MNEALQLSPNRWPGALHDFRYWVLHTTEGTDSLGWLTNPASQVSATFLVPRNGPNYFRLGWDDDAMWHAGFTCSPSTPFWSGGNPNLESRGIELEGFHDEPITDFQLEVWRELHARDPQPLVGHFELARCGPYYRSDPGAENFVRLQAAITGGDMALSGENVKDLIREMLKSDEGAILVEEAIRHPILPDGRGGYGAKLNDWLTTHFVQFPRALRRRGRTTTNPLEPIIPATPDGRGPRETWPPEFR